MSAPEYSSPEWFNQIALRAKKRIVELAVPVTRQYLKGGYAGGFAPLAIGLLQKMPIPDAVGFLTNMMQIPSTRANGVALFAQYLDWLERSGQLAPGAGRRLATQVAGAQLAGGMV